MITDKAKKFENPARLDELRPESTLRRAGFSEGMSLCDIGAGTGIFSVAAARISSAEVNALDISDEMLEIMRRKKAEENLQNLNILKVHSEELPLESGSCDFAIMVTVLHEIEDRDSMLKEIKRVLSENGKFLVIEFHKKATPMGPPVDHRIAKETVERLCSGSGFQKLEAFEMGDNFYGIIFKNKS